MPCFVFDAGVGPSESFVGFGSWQCLGDWGGVGNVQMLRKKCCLDACPAPNRPKDQADLPAARNIMEMECQLAPYDRTSVALGRSFSQIFANAPPLPSDKLNPQVTWSRLMLSSRLRQADGRLKA